MAKVEDIEPLLKEYKNVTTWTSLQELFSDLLGALMPGIIFTFVVWTGVYLLLLAIYGNSGFSSSIMSFINSMSLEVSVTFFVFAFIMGSVFYRKDPKEPDEKSARFIWKRTSEEERHTLAVQGENEKQLNVEFPYLYIYEYLCSRGYYHLAKHINWRGDDEPTYRLRSKMLINILKTRINYYRPNSMSEITKNEAHVRLMSSLWYCIKWSINLLLLFSIIVAIYMKICAENGTTLASTAPIIGFIITLIILFVAVRQSIIKFFHYQRVREIVIVLETAHIISHENNNIFLFEEEGCKKNSIN